MLNYGGGEGGITPDNIIRQESIFTLVSIGQKSGHGLAGGQAQRLSWTCRHLKFDWAGKKCSQAHVMAWLAGKRLQFFTSYLLLIRLSTEKKVGREGQKLGRHSKPFLRMACFDFCCFLLVTWANPGILWERFLEVKHYQGRLIDSHLPDWKPAPKPHNQCDESKTPHILSATPFLLEQEESYHIKVREGAWVWRPLIVILSQ